jgi:hypothetical protein
MINYSINAKNLEFEITLKKCANWPQYTFNQPYESQVEFENDNIKRVKVFIENPLDEIILTYTNKTSKDTIVVNNQIIADQSLSITKFWVNNVVIDLLLLKEEFKFFPKYDAQYIADSKRENKILPEVLSTVDLYYNGNLHFNIIQPFFIWYNKKQIAILEELNNLAKYSHLGFVNDDKIVKLKEIFDLLKK